MGSGSNVTVYADQRVFRELVTHPLYQVREDQAANIYQSQRAYWAERMLDPGYLDQTLASYSKAMEKPYLSSMAARIAGLAKTVPAGEPIRVLEIGGANAALLHWWKDHKPDAPLRYTGLEPYKPFVEHAAKQFPEAEMILGDAEAFLEMDFAGKPRFTAFVAATVFCMIHPVIVRKCLLKAAKLTDNILIRDYMINVQGGIAADGILTFDYYQKAHLPLMFAHHYQRFFDDIGFRVVHFEDARTEFDGPGWGLLHLVRAHPLRTS